ncbi:MAG: hypothetical protein RIS35_637 [Pseudomonadota bacterium]|jgi:hypothetical protein
MPTRYRRTRLAARPFWLLAWLPLIASLASCAAISPVSTPAQPPQIPQPPASLMTPVPHESYLERAQRNIETWRSRLTDSETR